MCTKNPQAQLVRRAMVPVLLGLLAAANVSAGDATLGFTAPSNTTKKNVKVTITYPNDQTYTISVEIAAGDTAIQKRDKIAAAIDAHAIPNWRVEKHATEAVLTIKDLPTGAVVKFDPGETGEIADTIRVGKLAVAAASFEGSFDPLDSAGHPAVFVAGLMTELGELRVRVSAAELDFQTEGPRICQALFQRLAPRAPQFGALVNFAGDRLEIYFDPAYTVTQGGLVFGTNSRSAGASGRATVVDDNDCNGNGIGDVEDILSGNSRDLNEDLVPDECQYRLGDLNCDGHVDFDDIDPFVLALGGADAYGAAYPDCQWLNGDCNGDGTVNFDDIDAFVAVLSGQGG